MLLQMDEILSNSSPSKMCYSMVYSGAIMITVITTYVCKIFSLTCCLCVSVPLIVCTLIVLVVLFSVFPTAMHIYVRTYSYF